MGRAIAEALAREGAAVALAARTKAEIERVASEIQAEGGRALAIKTDVRCEEDVLNLIKGVKDTFFRLDILVNCAGIGIFAPVVSMKTSDWDALIETNLKGAFLTCREALKVMMEQRSGHIINISSGLDRVGMESEAAYCASKFGLKGFSLALSLEARPYNIKVTVLSPGRTDTTFAGEAEEGEKDLLLKPEDVAKAVIDILTHSERAVITEAYLRPYRWSLT